MTFQIVSCVVIHWPLNGQQIKCVPNVSNPCPHSYVLKQKRNVKVKILCVMWNERINALTTNYSPTPLLEQKWMQALDVEEMESCSKIDLKDVSWCKSIKDTYKLGVMVTIKLLKERCITLVARGRPSHIACKHDWNKCGPPSTWKTYSFEKGLSKIWNLEHKYKATRTQLCRKANGVQSSIERRPIPPKEISSRA